MVIGLAAALIVGWQRHSLETANSQVEMVMDYEDIVTLAQMEGVPTADLMQQMKAAGITSLSVYETTLEKLNKTGKVSVVPGAFLLQQHRLGALTDPVWRELAQSGRIDAARVYVMGHNAETFAEVRHDLERRLSRERVQLLIDGPQPVLAVQGNFEKLEKWNLGLSREEMKAVSDAGFQVVVRPTNYTKVEEEDVAAMFARLDGIPHVSTLMFVGDEVLGFPNLLPQTAAGMKERGLTLGMIEHPLQLQFLKQDGLLPLANALDYQGARVYAIPKDEQVKLKVEEAIHRWAITDLERNIRINLIRIFEKPEPGKTLIETNLGYVEGVKNEVTSKGFTLGRATFFPKYFPAPLLVALMMLGTTAAGVMLLTQYRPFAAKYQYVLLIAGTALLAVPVLLGGGTLMRQAAATASAILFPVLSMTWLLDRWRAFEAGYAAHDTKSLLWTIAAGCGSLFAAVAFSIVGGLYVGALLADVRFFMEIEIFRGVKLMFVAPLVLITLIYFTRYNVFAEHEPMTSANVMQQVKKILNYPIYVKTLLAAGVAVLAAWVYIGRSGHTAGVPVPALEIKLRYFLEEVMYARPRGKEILIGHPGLMLMVMAVVQRWPRALHYVLVVLAMIGQGSLVETFAHMRTPVMMSFIRGTDGMLVGAVCGIAALILAQLAHRFLFVPGRRTAR